MDASMLTAQLRGLYAETHILELGSDEFTVSMFAEANGCNAGTANRLIQRAIDQGRIEPVGDRLHLKRRAAAFKFVEPA